MPQPISHKAMTFAIWRAAETSDWVTTPEEIAAEIGEIPETVEFIMRERGWLERLDQNVVLPADLAFRAKGGVGRG